MAAQSRRQVQDDGVRFNFRLNPRRPKERIILEFLRNHAENYDASRIIKQALYEMATGRSWLNEQPIKPAAMLDDETEFTPAARNDQLLNDMLAGLDDWMTS